MNRTTKQAHAEDLGHRLFCRALDEQGGRDPADDGEYLDEEAARIWDRLERVKRAMAPRDALRFSFAEFRAECEQRANDAYIDRLIDLEQERRLETDGYAADIAADRHERWMRGDA